MLGHPGVVRILSIDGGGARGIIPATILTRIEAMAGRPVQELFDMVAGSSTGAVLSLLLATPDEHGKPLYSAQDCLNCYLSDVDKVFYRGRSHTLFSLGGLYRQKFSIKRATATLGKFFGDAELKDLVLDALITSYDIDQHRPLFFTRSAAIEDPGSNYFLRDVARGAFAAPCWFPTAQLQSVTGSSTSRVVDGGVFANNPSGCALAEAVRLHGWNRSFVIVSIGTGRGPLPEYPVGRHGIITWASRLLDLLFDGQTNATHHQLTQLLGGPGRSHGYYRLQPEIASAHIDVGNVHPENLSALEACANRYVDQNTNLIQELGQRLVAQPPLRAGTRLPSEALPFAGTPIIPREGLGLFD